MIEIIRGKARNGVVAAQLADEVSRCVESGTLYIGYPILASADDTTTIDALLVSEQTGLVIFHIPELLPARADAAWWSTIANAQDELFFAVTTNLGRHRDLRKGKSLGVPINTVTYLPTEVAPPAGVNALVAGPRTLAGALKECERLDPVFLRPLQAALQRVSTIKPAKKRVGVTRGDSRGAFLKEIEKGIANLDQWQKRAAIEAPEGPQRIRGLAGSGKTIVLALKAAYLHALNPEWNIALTFYTRSLHQQFVDLVRRFSFEHLNDEPNWQKLRVLHAWGSSGRPGLYSEMAAHANLPARDYLYAKRMYGRRDAFVGVCQELLSAVRPLDVAPIYDAVLIDEAQDLPWPFFQLVYRFAKEPRRIIWAYDELQNLSDFSMPPIEELFGKDDQDRPLVSLSNTEGQPHQDVMLPVCYRNSPWALTMAHALGFGIYRKAGLVQLFDEPALWTEIGYELMSGGLRLGEEVCLRRAKTSYPEYFERCLKPEDAISSHIFDTTQAQYDWVASQVARNLSEDELETNDVLIILPDPLTAKTEAVAIINALAKYKIPAHLAGVMTSQDEMFVPDSVAIASIYRAKGNEAPMVYLLNCEYGVHGHELIKARNTLFTGITRSRAWVRLCGCGAGMLELKQEVDAVVRNQFRLCFTIPKSEDLARLRMIHRERTASEKAKIKKAEDGLKDLVRLVEAGEMAPENLPPELRAALVRLTVALPENGGDDVAP